MRTENAEALHGLKAVNRLEKVDALHRQRPREDPRRTSRLQTVDRIRMLTASSSTSKTRKSDIRNWPSGVPAGDASRELISGETNSGERSEGVWAPGGRKDARSGDVRVGGVVDLAQGSGRRSNVMTLERQGEANGCIYEPRPTIDRRTRADVALAGDLDLAAHLLDDALDDAHAEAGAGRERTRLHERREERGLEELGRHSLARIAQFDHRVGARIRWLELNAELDRAAGERVLARVAGHVEEDASEAGEIERDRPVGALLGVDAKGRSACRRPTRVLRE